MIGVLLRIYSKTCECQRSLTCLFRHWLCLQNMNQKQNKQFTGPLLRFPSLNTHHSASWQISCCNKCKTSFTQSYNSCNLIQSRNDVSRHRIIDKSVRDRCDFSPAGSLSQQLDGCVWTNQSWSSGFTQRSFYFYISPDCSIYSLLQYTIPQ